MLTYLTTTRLIRITGRSSVSVLTSHSHLKIFSSENSEKIVENTGRSDEDVSSLKVSMKAFPVYNRVYSLQLPTIVFTAG